MYEITPKTIFGVFLCLLGISIFLDIPIPIIKLLTSGILLYSGLVMIVGSLKENS